MSSAADLPNHVSLSVPYLSNTLSDMVQQSREMLHRERKTLWNVKRLLTRLRGDETWIPCGNLTFEMDNIIFDTESVYNEIVKKRLRTDSAETVGRGLPNGNGSPPAFSQRGSTKGVEVLTAEAITNGIPKEVDTKSHAIAEPENKVGPLDSTKNLLDPSEEIPSDQASHSISTRQHANAKAAQEVASPAEQVVSNSTEKRFVPIHAIRPLELNHDAAVSTNIYAKQDELIIADAPKEPETDQDQVEQRSVDATIGSTVEMENVRLDQDITLDAEVKTQDLRGGEDDDDDALQPPPRRMTTRAQALATSENNTNSSRTRSASAASWVPPAIHPLFLMPPSAHPDRNFGLPSSEAEDIRRMVMLYVQKQEEVCRGAEKLYVGLLRADRMRKTVFKWCKAEAHVGEMSDGEDWYDKEEWGLDEDLRKGHDDEEDDAVTQGKKTRGRRA